LRLRRGERSMIAGLGRADHAGGLHNVCGFIASASPCTLGRLIPFR
jgi:hypothetical protein